MLKAFYREVKTGDVWKERTNKKLKVLYNEPKRIRWMGHIEKFENAKMTKMVPSQKPIGKRRKGRPRKICMESVMEDLLKILLEK